MGEIEVTISRDSLDTNEDVPVHIKKKILNLISARNRVKAQYDTILSQHKVRIASTREQLDHSKVYVDAVISNLEQLDLSKRNFLEEIASLKSQLSQMERSVQDLNEDISTQEAKLEEVKKLNRDCSAAYDVSAAFHLRHLIALKKDVERYESRIAGVVGRVPISATLVEGQLPPLEAIPDKDGGILNTAPTASA